MIENLGTIAKSGSKVLRMDFIDFFLIFLQITLSRNIIYPSGITYLPTGRTNHSYKGCQNTEDTFIVSLIITFCCRNSWKPFPRSPEILAAASLVSLEWASTRRSWWRRRWRCTHSPTSRAVRPSAGPLMGKDTYHGGTKFLMWTLRFQIQDRVHWFSSM